MTLPGADGAPLPLAMAAVQFEPDFFSADRHPDTYRTRMCISIWYDALQALAGTPARIARERGAHAGAWRALAWETVIAAMG
jgi:hypothetical protein